jgi:hypothetical protein
MNLPYNEGTWFSVPLRNGSFTIGVVARTTNEGKVILCYFFGPARPYIPKYDEIKSLKPSNAICVVRVGDLSLLKGEWPIISHSTSWKRSDWVMPPFVRRDDLSHKAWRVCYSDINPNLIDHEESEPYESTLERDAVLGAGAAELVLTKLLAPKIEMS